MQPLRDLLNGVLQFQFTNLFKKTSKRKIEHGTFLGKKTEEKENSASIMISVDGKGTVFPVKLKL